jgi:hypothetical protein
MPLVNFVPESIPTQKTNQTQNSLMVESKRHYVLVLTALSSIEGFEP